LLLNLTSDNLLSVVLLFVAIRKGLAELLKLLQRLLQLETINKWRVADLIAKLEADSGEARRLELLSGPMQLHFTFFAPDGSGDSKRKEFAKSILERVSQSSLNHQALKMLKMSSVFKGAL
jgi:hypothetical protein